MCKCKQSLPLFKIFDALFKSYLMDAHQQVRSPNIIEPILIMVAPIETARG